METNTVIVWFRGDLRLTDNPALSYACKNKAVVIPVFIYPERGDKSHDLGSASKVWLHHSLLVLEKNLAKAGASLLIRRGPVDKVLSQLRTQTQANKIVWNRLYEPGTIARDTQVKSSLQKQGIEVKTFNAGLLNEPHTVKNKQGLPFRVFTPFWRHCQTLEPIPAPVPTVKKIKASRVKLASVPILELDLLPTLAWHHTISQSWRPGYVQALKQLDHFIDSGLPSYLDTRDYPAIEGTSKLSPYLHFGEISPRQIWHRLYDRAQQAGKLSPSDEAVGYIRQLYWREFAQHLLYHFPQTPTQPLYEKYQAFPWRESNKHLRAWQQGLTGYPLVDAGMRELWHSGWMHNRVRMIVGSFLVKDLLIHWRQGAAWFWDTLLDADLANNTMGWQWIAGCGADAAPYFRVFNPLTQSQRFDKEAAYIRQWLPELAKLDNKTIHQPWQAPAELLAGGGVKLGKDYPLPIVDHATARNRALAALASIKQ